MRSSENMAEVLMYYSSTHYKGDQKYDIKQKISFIKEFLLL